MKFDVFWLFLDSVPFTDGFYSTLTPGMFHSVLFYCLDLYYLCRGPGCIVDDKGDYDLYLQEQCISLHASNQKMYFFSWIHREILFLDEIFYSLVPSSSSIARNIRLLMDPFRLLRDLKIMPPITLFKYFFPSFFDELVHFPSVFDTVGG